MNEHHDPDAALIRTLREGTDPGPRPEARRAVFIDETARRALRGGRRRSARWLAVGALASGAAAVLLVAFTGLGPGSEPAAPAGPSLASYAYYETDVLAAEEGTDLASWLSEDQAALSAAFDLP